MWASNKIEVCLRRSGRGEREERDEEMCARRFYTFGQELDVPPIL